MKVLVSLNIPEVGIEMLRKANMEVDVWQDDTPMTQTRLIEKSGKNDALLCTTMDRIDAFFLEKSRHLKIISIYAAGYDNIDVEAATRMGIPVGNSPNAMVDATADIAFALMLAVARKMFFLHKTIEKGEWDHFKPRSNLGVELKKKTLGIFGLGTIGFEMANRCRGAYGMDVIYFNRNRNSEAEQKLKARKVSFEDLLKISDVLSVHSILTPETTGIFDRSAFAQMKQSSIFINTARGAIHNEKDLMDALINNKIWGAGLDVTNPEPMEASNPLLSMENVAITPHIGSATKQARDEMSRLAAQNIIHFFQKKGIPHLVNPHYNL